MRHSVPLPRGWAATELGQIRVDLSRALDPRQYPDEDFELYSVPSFADGEPEVVKGRAIGSTKMTLTPGTVVVCKINPRINRVWVVGDRSPHKKIGSGEWIPFFPVDGVTPHFLAYYLQRDHFRNFLAARVSGVGGSLMRVRPTTLDGYPLPIPSVSEQQRIVEAIESYLTRLGNAVALLERVEENLKRYRASVLKAAVEGRLVPTEAELARREGRSYEPASELLKRILAERQAHGSARRPRTSPGTEGDVELPELPEGWCWTSIGQLAADEPYSLTDGPFGSNLKTAHYTETGPRVVRLQNIADGAFVDEEAHISEGHYATLKKHAVYAGDIVIASLGEHLPKACLVPDWLGPAIVKADCLRLKPDPRLVDSRYLLCALNSEPLRARTGALIHGLGRPRIGLTLLRALKVPLPPRPEQDRIAREVEADASIAAAVSDQLETQVTKCAALRQSILKWAFEGKLIEQDPNDEPASVLLERIKAERAAATSPKARGRQKRSAE